MNCPSCGKMLPLVGSAAFCPHCGEKIVLSGDEGLNRLLLECENESDYAKKHALLMKAREQYPNEIEIEKRLLYIGRLWERGGKPDFYRIPFWPLSALEKPGDFSRKERAKMLSTFFKNPEAERVAALHADKAAFYNEYYIRMAAGYIEWFIKDCTTNNMVLFFRRSEKSRQFRYAECVRTMLTNLAASEDVSAQQKEWMATALKCAYEQVFGEAHSL